MVNYSSDKPINYIDDDKYSRGDYSKRIAKILIKKNSQDNLVVGLYAPWGYGKTSILNMIKENIHEKALVISFNPWIFDNQTAVVMALLFDLAEKLDEPTDNKSEWGRFKDRVTQYGLLTKQDSAVSLITDYAGIVSVGVSALASNNLAGTGFEKTAAIVKKFLKTSSIEQIKLKVEEKIQDYGKPVIIMIDDVDRLDNEEVFQLFKLIKIIADFKGLTYLVAFDDEAVAAALNDRFGAAKGSNSGQEFLEKIIQVPLHAPLIHKEALDKEVFNGIDGILKESKVDITEDDINDFRYLYDQSISPLIKSPRAVKRYLNSLKFTFPLVKREVNTADFLIIEAVRLFYPNKYTKLRAEKELLIGTKFHRYLQVDSDDEKGKELTEEIIGEDTQLREVIMSLFPAVNKYYEKHSSGKSLKELRVDKRVASPDYYDRYFTYGINAADVSDTDILEILISESAEQIAKSLIPLLKDKKQELIIAKLRMYYKNASNPVELAKAMLDVVSELSQNKQTVFSYSPIEQSVDVISDIIKESVERLKLINVLISHCKDYEQLFYLIREVVLHSKADSREPILNQEELKQFEQQVVIKFRKESKIGPLHNKNSKTAHILYKYWAEMGDKEEVDKYLQSVLKTSDDVLDFLTLNLARWSGTRGHHRGNFDEPTFREVSKVVDPEYLYNILIETNPSIKGAKEYVDLEDSDEGVGRVGNEDSTEFRNILAAQYAYIFENFSDNA